MPRTAPTPVASGLLLDALFQSGQVGRHLLGRFAAHHQRDQDLPDAVAGEVNTDGQLRTAGVDWFDGDLDDGADRPIDPAHAPGLRRVDVRDLRDAGPFGSADAAGGVAFGAHRRWAAGFQVAV